MSLLRGYLFEQYSNMAGARTVEHICEEASKQNIDLQVVGLCDCFWKDGQIIHKGVALEPVDFVIQRYKYGKLKREIAKLATRNYNSLDAFEIYVNKFEQMKRLQLTDCRTPEFLLTTLALPYKEVVTQVGTPFILKGLESSQGREIYLIHSPKEYEECKETWGIQKEFVCQRFIEESCGRDIRMYSVRGKVIGAMMRENPEDFRANVARGACVKAYPISDSMARIAGEIYEQTGLDFLGIDLLDGKDCLYFCEINVMAGIEGMEKATGVNVAKAIIDTIREDFENADGKCCN